jgi:hypothetical protein
MFTCYVCCDVDRAAYNGPWYFSLPGTIIGILTNFHCSWQFRRSSPSKNIIKGNFIDDAPLSGWTLTSATECSADFHEIWCINSLLATPNFVKINSKAGTHILTSINYMIFPVSFLFIDRSWRYSLHNVSTWRSSANESFVKVGRWKLNIMSTGIPRYTRSHFTRFRYNAI